MNNNKDKKKNDILANIAIINGVISFFLIIDFFALQFSNNEAKIVIAALINFLALIIGFFEKRLYILFNIYCI